MTAIPKQNVEGSKISDSKSFYEWFWEGHDFSRALQARIGAGFSP
jgi:hypothetical protein